MFNLIYADPPWEYVDKCKDGKRGAGFKYPTMKAAEIARLPILQLANPESCLLAMWWVPTQPEEALLVMKAWGFRLMTMKGFTWHKTYKNKNTTALGMGHMTRANSEDLLFGVRGKLPLRHSAKISQHFSAPRTEHSAKPPIVRDMLVELLGDIPRVELFARGRVSDGWHGWGNQCENGLELRPAAWPLPDFI